VIKHALRERLATGVGTQIGGETKGFIYRKVSLNYEHGSTRHLLFLEYMSSSTIQHTIDATNCYFWAL
jgi:hypothetical protein